MAPFNFDKLSLERQDHDEQRRVQDVAYGYTSAVYDFVHDVLFDRRWFWPFVSMLISGEAMLCLIIIKKIPYTKIDYTAYMQQVDMFLSGERDYSKIEGETGPLVYPALHLYIYTALRHAFGANNIVPVQIVFAAVYLATLALVAVIYRRAGAPQLLLVPLALSKRAHSVYMLRLFNDPFGMVFLYAAVAVMMRDREGKGKWRLASGLYSLALGVKMNALLFLPGLAVLLVQHTGVLGTLECLGVIAAVQILLPAPFFCSLRDSQLSKAYLSSAFDFSREFLYKWTVNWRFVPEQAFLSSTWSRLLLATHVALLMAFAWSKWAPTSQSTTLGVLSQALKRPRSPPTGAWSLSAAHTPLVLLTSNLIGMLCARSLHYQFHSWYFHQIPLLLYLGGAHGNLALGTLLWSMIEYAWSTFPSTKLSSGILLIAHVIMLAGLFARDGRAPVISAGDETPPRRLSEPNAAAGQEVGTASK